jgi:hypothetical protein
MTVSFDDAEMQLILEAAHTLPVTSRDAFLQSIAAQMKPRRIDLAEAIRRSLNYLQLPDGKQSDAA